MQIHLGKRRLTGGLAVAAGLAACAGSLMSAEASFAAAPAGGINCVSSDGKVNGRGSSFQTRAQGDFWAAYATDVCGSVPSQGSNDTTVTGNMGVYNYSGATGFTGSGAGLKAANCRTDAYAGTDIPYSEAQLVGLNGTPGGSPIGGCGTFPVQPFAPNASTNTGTPAYPASTDAASPIMSIPIAGSSIDIAINLTAANCGGTKPSSIAFTGAQMDLIWGGSALNWNDSRLFTAGGQNASLANCSVPIQRVVRQDSSGTTNIFKSYLARVNDARTGATCNPGPTWTSFNAASGNTSWPGPGSATCSPLVVPSTSGATALVQLLNTTTGGIGYADLADITQGNVPALINASLRNGVDTGFAAPKAGNAANCDLSVLLLPGGTPSDSVGLNTNENWGNDNAAVNGTGDHVNATNLGSKYPICGVTFDLVYSNLGLGGGSTPNPIVAMTADQRRTLYSYLTYVLSSTAQAKMPNDFYAPLPSSWLPTLVAGFQGTGGY